MSIHVEGTDQILGVAVTLRQAPRRVEREGPEVVRSAAGHVVQVAKSVVAIDTGATWESIGADWEAGSLEATAGPTTSYAHFLEAGTSRQSPQPFMGPAADAAEPGFLAAAADIADPFGAGVRAGGHLR